MTFRTFRESRVYGNFNPEVRLPLTIERLIEMF
jgi:hypothetical protein